MEHRRVCFCMLSLLPLVQISKLSQANSLLFGKVCCRTPRGVRGLKYQLVVLVSVTQESHPSRGAWIEIRRVGGVGASAASRTPRGVRGLKSPPPPTERALSRRTPRGVRGLKSGTILSVRQIPPGRTPRGVRGLKYTDGVASVHLPPSHPSRGAWIEILRRNPRR